MTGDCCVVKFLICSVNGSYIRELKQTTTTTATTTSPNKRFNEQAPVVQRLDNAIHRINHYPADSVVFLLTFIHWIVIYPADSVIQPLNNPGQNNSCPRAL